MSLVKVYQQEHIAYIVLNRPDVRNAFNPDMISELTQVFTDLEKNKETRLACLYGEGKVFCSGADLSWMKDMMNYSFEQNREDAQQLYKMFDAAARCPVPIIGMVHGSAFGGALGLLAICDDVIAEKDAQFCFSEVKLGIAPAVISTFILRKAHLGFVQPYMISGQVFDAEAALRAGLVHELAESGAGLETLKAKALKWLEAGPEAAREIKKLLYDLGPMDKAQELERTTRLIAERRVSSEGQEGLKSFLEKRRPSWRDS